MAEVDRKAAAPMLPEFQDYVLDELITRKILRKLKAFALHEKLDAWLLELLPDDKNVVEVLELELKEGKITIPGATAGKPDGFDGVTSVTSYLHTFGVDAAERIRNQFIINSLLTALNERKYTNEGRTHPIPYHLLLCGV